MTSPGVSGDRERGHVSLLIRLHTPSSAGIRFVGFRTPSSRSIAFLLVIPAFIVDRVVARQRMHEAQLHAEQLRVLRMTMRTVQDIVGNGLTSLYLFRADAEPYVTPEALAFFDGIVAETAAKLKAIGDLETVRETPMTVGMGIDYPQ